MNKLKKDDYEKYWKKNHIQTKDDLAAVCFPDKPMYFNLFFDNIQKYIIRKYIKKSKIDLHNKTLLDLGCGRGRWLDFFSKEYNAIPQGVDLSSDAVEICKNKGLSALECSITNLPFDNESFDYISSVTVLLHLPYDIKKEAISELSRVLKPGGKIFLIESTWDDPSAHVYSLKINEWVTLFDLYDLELHHSSGHCFNIVRNNIPRYIPFKDFFAILLDYPIEYLLMNYYYNRQSKLSLQHFMVFEKCK